MLKYKPAYLNKDLMMTFCSNLLKIFVAFLRDFSYSNNIVSFSQPTQFLIKYSSRKFTSAYEITQYLL